MRAVTSGSRRDDNGNENEFYMSNPFGFLNDYVARSALGRRDALARIERSLDKAIKFPSEQTAWKHPVVVGFEKWLR